MKEKERRELDIWLAENPMEWHTDITKSFYFDSRNREVMPVSDWHPTTNIAQAFGVVEQLKQDELVFDDFRRNLAGYFNYDFGQLLRHLDDIVECICVAAKKAWEAK